MVSVSKISQTPDPTLIYYTKCNAWVHSFPSLYKYCWSDVHIASSDVGSENTACRTFSFVQLKFIDTGRKTFSVLCIAARYWKQAFLRTYKGTVWILCIKFFAFVALEHRCWVSTKAEAINTRVLRISYVLQRKRIFTFDDSAIRAENLTYARTPLMVVDIIVGAREISDTFLDTEMKLLAIVCVRKISVWRTNETGLRLFRLACLIFLSTAHSFVAVRSFGVLLTADIRT